MKIIYILLASVLVFSCKPQESPKATTITADKTEKKIEKKTDKPAGDAEKKEHAKHEDVSLNDLMTQLGKNMNVLNDALWAEDFPTVSKAAMQISDHPHVGPTDKMKIVKALGKDMPKFGAADKKVHEAAKKLSEAADKKDMPVILSTLSELQNGCVNCHGAFRSRLRDAFKKP